MRNKFFEAVGLSMACTLLASCGGGGGGGSGDEASHVTFTPSSIQVLQTEGYEEAITTRVAISPEPSGSQFFAVVVADRPVLETRSIFVIANADDSATVTARTDPNLAAGTYDGQLTLRLCRDSQCRDEVALTGNALPYSIKVLPRVQLDVTGAVGGYLGTPGSYSVATGATVVVTSNIPVTWSTGSSISGADLVVISSTSTRWEGQIVGRPGLFIGVAATSIEKPTNSAQAIFNMW